MFRAVAAIAIVSFGCVPAIANPDFHLHQRSPTRWQPRQRRSIPRATRRDPFKTNWASTYGFLRHAAGGTLETFDVPNTFDGLTPTGINDRGTIVGWWRDGRS